MRVTQRPDWPEAVASCYKFFTGSVYKGEPLEARIVFYLQMLQDCELLAQGRKILDLGAGIYWFDPLVKLLGAEPVLVDDFGGGGGVDAHDRNPAQQILFRYQKELGIRIVEQNILTQPLNFEDSSIDGVTCFHSLEHWGHSPKALFKEIFRILKPGGYLFLATPNAANLRKRLTVPLGYNSWSSLKEWYHEGPDFRGHVREPIIRDLHDLCRWNQLRVVATYGRNFIGRDSQVLAWLPRPLRHGLAASTQIFLKYFPTLCSDIHVVATKPK